MPVYTISVLPGIMTSYRAEPHPSAVTSDIPRVTIAVKRIGESVATEFFAKYAVYNGGVGRRTDVDEGVFFSMDAVANRPRAPYAVSLICSRSEFMHPSGCSTGRWRIVVVVKSKQHKYIF